LIVDYPSATQEEVRRRRAGAISSEIRWSYEHPVVTAALYGFALGWITALVQLFWAGYRPGKALIAGVATFVVGAGITYVATRWKANRWRRDLEER
jgi:hypothetical protein